MKPNIVNISRVNQGLKDCFVPRHDRILLLWVNSCNFGTTSKRL
ncbi:hypothetical protein [Geminocystis sp. CENA526]